jgi:hypothetical protein
VDPPGVFNQPFNQHGVRKPDKDIMTTVLVADFIDDRAIIVRTISGRIKGADKSDGLRVRKAIELFVQVRSPRLPKGDGNFAQGHGPKPFA